MFGLPPIQTAIPPWSKKMAAIIRRVLFKTGECRMIAKCIECGCDDLHACESGCCWVRLDRAAGLGVCSECAHRVSGWDAGDRTLGEEHEFLSELEGD